MPTELTIDVTDAVGLGEPLHTRATVVLPDPARMPDPPVVCFGFPGFGYSRGYFTFDMPDSSGGGQAGWHAARGWIFVACDHLCVGESATPSDAGAVTFEHLAAANHFTVTQILRLLAEGLVAHDFPTVREPSVLGVGQSMGGAFTVMQQAHHATFDAIAVLGFSAVGIDLTASDDLPDPETIRELLRAAAEPDESGLPGLARSFHFGDVPREIVLADMVDYPTRRGDVPAWGSATAPRCALDLTSRDVIAREAAVVEVPVFVGVGERDVVPTPRDEPRAYSRSSDIMVAIHPRMAHMHNMASTRALLWQRLHAWGNGVAAAR